MIGETREKTDHILVDRVGNRVSVQSPLNSVQTFGDHIVVWVHGEGLKSRSKIEAEVRIAVLMSLGKSRIEAGLAEQEVR